MAKGKKAKLANRKKVAEDMGTTIAPTIISGGHRVAHSLDRFTVCGERRVPWFFGTPADVTCEQCKETTA